MEAGDGFEPPCVVLHTTAYHSATPPMIGIRVRCFLLRKPAVQRVASARTAAALQQPGACGSRRRCRRALDASSRAGASSFFLYYTTRERQAGGARVHHAAAARAGRALRDRVGMRPRCVLRGDFHCSGARLALQGGAKFAVEGTQANFRSSSIPVALMQAQRVHIHHGTSREKEHEGLSASG